MLWYVSSQKVYKTMLKINNSNWKFIFTKFTENVLHLKLKKCLNETWPIDHVSISSTLYARIFRTNVILAAFFLVTCTLLIHGKSCQNSVCTKNSYVKRWWNWHQCFSTVSTDTIDLFRDHLNHGVHRAGLGGPQRPQQ